MMVFGLFSVCLCFSFFRLMTFPIDIANRFRCLSKGETSKLRMNNGIDCVVLSSISFTHIQSNCVEKRLRSLAAIFHSVCVWNLFFFSRRSLLLYAARATLCWCTHFEYVSRHDSMHCCWNIRISVNDWDFPKCRYKQCDGCSIKREFRQLPWCSWLNHQDQIYCNADWFARTMNAVVTILLTHEIIDIITSTNQRIRQTKTKEMMRFNLNECPINSAFFFSSHLNA